MPKISLVIPSHDTPPTSSFLARLFDSLAMQTMTDFEIVFCQGLGCGGNLNSGIMRAKGELIKILCHDDWLTHPNSLKDIVNNFTGNWMITGSHNNPHPVWTDQVPLGFNTLGGLSTITMKNDKPLYFDENLVWMIDVEFYDRAFKKWGPPTILDSVNVNIGLHNYQATNLMSLEAKQAECELLNKRYGN